MSTAKHIRADVLDSLASRNSRAGAAVFLLVAAGIIYYEWGLYGWFGSNYFVAILHWLPAITMAFLVWPVIRQRVWFVGMLLMLPLVELCGSLTAWGVGHGPAMLAALVGGAFTIVVFGRLFRNNGLRVQHVWVFRHTEFCSIMALQLTAYRAIVATLMPGHSTLDVLSITAIASLPTAVTLLLRYAVIDESQVPDLQAWTGPHCLRCGYSLGESQICPECGWSHDALIHATFNIQAARP